MNILTKNWKEAEVDIGAGVQGMWKVEVVCPNGEIKKPLGDEFRPNLIQDVGLNLLHGQINQNSVSDITNLKSLASIMNGALYGYASGGGVNSVGTSYTTTLASGPSLTAGSSRVIQSASFTTEIATGSRAVTKIYDFGAVSAPQTVKEIGIGAFSISNEFGGQLDPIGKNYALFSRFVLPGDGVLLESFQFLRVTYTLKMTIPAIITEIPVNVSSGGFSGLGYFKCVGTFNDLFGSIQNDGTAIDGYAEVPWTLIGRGTNQQAVPEIGAIQVYCLDQAGQQTPEFSAVNGPFGSHPIVGSTVTTTTAGSSAVPSSRSSQIAVVNNACSKEATLLFPASNPSTQQFIGGIFFRPTNTSMGTNSIGNTPNAGWYWKFTDTLGGPRGQLKEINFALAINVRQTISRL